MPVKTIEMFCCYSDGTWQNEHFVQIPADTPKSEIESLAIDTAWHQFTDKTIELIGVYSLSAEPHREKHDR